MLDDVRLYLLKGSPLPSQLVWTDDLLSAEEHARSQRFVFDLHRDRFRFRRAVLRIIVATELGIVPADLRLMNNCWGKPYWANRSASQNIHFNLSHSGDAIAIAVSKERSIGVDIEQHRTLPEIRSMARMVMHAKEFEEWESQPQDSQPNSFFNLWALKEAVLKCVGCGLAIEPASFCVHPNASIDSDRSIELKDPNGTHWPMRSRLLSSFAGYSSALTVCVSPS